jgi:DHA1 family bicyclomycin/chloramphenicol resistance-like MFS transporter
MTLSLGVAALAWMSAGRRLAEAGVTPLAPRGSQ